MARIEAPAANSTGCHPAPPPIRWRDGCRTHARASGAHNHSSAPALVQSEGARSAFLHSCVMRGASTRRVVITIGEAPGGEEACDTSSSSDGEGSSDEDEGSDDNALNRPIEQV